MKGKKLRLCCKKLNRGDVYDSIKDMNHYNCFSINQFNKYIFGG